MDTSSVLATDENITQKVAALRADFGLQDNAPPDTLETVGGAIGGRNQETVCEQARSALFGA